MMVRRLPNSLICECLGFLNAFMVYAFIHQWVEDFMHKNPEESIHKPFSLLITTYSCGNVALWYTSFRKIFIVAGYERNK